MTPAEHREEAERLLASAKIDELGLQDRRRAHDGWDQASREFVERLIREREVDVLLTMAAVHATLATVAT